MAYITAFIGLNLIAFIFLTLIFGPSALVIIGMFNLLTAIFYAGKGIWHVLKKCHLTPSEDMVGKLYVTGFLILFAWGFIPQFLHHWHLL